MFHVQLGIDNTSIRLGETGSLLSLLKCFGEDFSEHVTFLAMKEKKEIFFRLTIPRRDHHSASLYICRICMENSHLAPLYFLSPFLLVRMRACVFSLAYIFLLFKSNQIRHRGAASGTQVLYFGFVLSPHLGNPKISPYSLKTTTSPPLLNPFLQSKPPLAAERIEKTGAQKWDVRRIRLVRPPCSSQSRFMSRRFPRSLARLEELVFSRGFVD